jgi:very-short-patch-repair endonuclease
MEYPIPIPRRQVLAQGFESPPLFYKVDLALVDQRIAIAVDGRSHNSRRWRFWERRKTAILGLLGWSVLKFSNERVLNDPDEVIAEIVEFSTSR